MSRTRGWPATAAISLAVGLFPVVQYPRVAPAQQAAGASPELIDAIIRHTYRFEGGNVRLLNGRVPDDLGANFYAPPGTRIVGSVVMGSSVLVFATSTTPVDSLRALYTRGLAPAGWRPFAWPSRGGFVERQRDRPLMFCRDGAQLHIQPSRASGSTDLVLNYRDGMGACDRSSETAMTGMRGRPEFPTLYAPEDTGRSRTRCYSAGGVSGGMGTGTFVPTTMSAAELLRHYARQLESAGWRPAPATESATGTWTLADSSGLKEVRIEVASRGATGLGCYDVQMKMSERAR